MTLGRNGYVQPVELVTAGVGPARNGWVQPVEIVGTGGGNAVDETGSTTDSFVEVFTETSIFGLFGIGTILNTGANGLNIRETVVDKFGSTISKTTLVPAGDSYLLDLQTNFLNITTAYPPFTSYEVEVEASVAGNQTTYELHFIDMGPGAGGGGGGGAESLDQARAVGDTFTGGDVYWDDANGAIFGKASGETGQDYLHIYSDKTNNIQVFDSTKDGAGVVRPISWQMGGVARMALSIAGRLSLPSGGIDYSGDILPTAGVEGSTKIGDASHRILAAYSAAGYLVLANAGDANATGYYESAALHFGAGGASAQDLRLRRSAAKTFTFDDNAAGNCTVIVQGKLTVTGAIDPTSLSLSGNAEGANVLYLDSANGVSAGLSAAGHARIRYNDTAKAWQQSVDGGAYSAFGGGGISGSGTADRIVKFTGATAVGNSVLTESGTGIDPVADQTTALGTSTFRYTSLRAQIGVLIFSGSGDLNAKASLVQTGVFLGPGGGTAANVSLTRQGGGEARIATSDASDIQIWLNNSQQAVYKSDGTFLYGVTTMPTMEPDDVPRWIFANDNSAFVDFLVQNTSAATSAGTCISCISTTKNGARLCTFNDAWDGSTATGFNPGDAGLGYVSGTGSIVAGARLIIASGPIPLSFLTGSSGEVERGRFTSNGTLIIGTDYTEIQAGNVFFQVSKNQNAFTGAYVSNTTDGSGSIVGWSLLGPSSRSGFIGMTAPSYTPSGSQLADQVQILANSVANGINLITTNGSPISFHTTGAVLVNKATAFDSGHCMFEVEKNQNTYTTTRLGNTTDGANSSIALVFESNSSKFTEIGRSATSYTATAAWGAEATFISHDAGSGGLILVTMDATAITMKTNGNNARLTIASDGGLVAGAATGGSQGAGTINVSGDLFKNGLAYTNPKWVLQHYYTGRADKDGPYEAPEEYGGLMSLAVHEEVVRSKHDLPLMLLKPKGGYMERGDLLLASVEEAYLYIYQLNRRISELEKKLAA